MVVLNQNQVGAGLASLSIFFNLHKSNMAAMQFLVYRKILVFVIQIHIFIFVCAQYHGTCYKNTKSYGILSFKPTFHLKIQSGKQNSNQYGRQNDHKLVYFHNLYNLTGKSNMLIIFFIL